MAAAQCPLLLCRFSPRRLSEISVSMASAIRHFLLQWCGVVWLRAGKPGGERQHASWHVNLPLVEVVELLVSSEVGTASEDLVEVPSSTMAVKVIYHAMGDQFNDSSKCTAEIVAQKAARSLTCGERSARGPLSAARPCDQLDNSLFAVSGGVS